MIMNISLVISLRLSPLANKLSYTKCPALPASLAELTYIVSLHDIFSHANSPRQNNLA